MRMRQRLAWSVVTSQASKAAMWIALFSLLMGLAVIAVVLTSASIQGELPFKHRILIFLPFHPPMRGVFGIVDGPKKNWLIISLRLMPVSALCSMFSILLRPNWRSWILLGCAIAAMRWLLFSDL